MVPSLTATLCVQMIRIGGGTALAARWEYRASTDIDITVTATKFDKEAGRLASLFGRSSGVRNLKRAHGWMKGDCEEGELLIFTTAPLLPAETRPPDRESVWAIPLENTDEILARKLLLRMYGNGEFVARDLYNIATAAEMDSAPLGRALTILDEIQREEIAGEIASLGVRAAELGRPLMKPHRPDWLPRLVGIASALVADGVPAPEPLSRPQPGNSSSPGF